MTGKGISRVCEVGIIYFFYSSLQKVFFFVSATESQETSRHNLELHVLWHLPRTGDKWGSS